MTNKPSERENIMKVIKATAISRSDSLQRPVKQLSYLTHTHKQAPQPVPFHDSRFWRHLYSFYFVTIQKIHYKYQVS